MEMSFNTIVLIILAILALTTVVLFFTGGMSKLTKAFVQSSAGATSTAQITSVRAQCINYCLSMNNILADTDAATDQPYCTTYFYLTEDGNNDDEDRCYDSIVTGGTDCEVVLSSGQTVRIDKSTCEGGNFGQIGVVTG